MRILFISPYPELRDTVENVFRSHPRRRDIDMEIRIMTVDQVSAKDVDAYDVVIARGLTARRVRSILPQMPFVDLTISGYDVVRTLAECRRDFGAKHIAVCGFYEKIYETATLCRLMDCEITLYPVETFAELEKSIGRAQADGCDAIIGGYSAIGLARSRAIPCKLICSGKDAITHAINVAVETVEQIRHERVIAELYKTVIYTSKDGVLYVDADGIIQVRNHVVKDMNLDASLLHKPLKATLSYLYAPFMDVLLSGQGIEGRVITIPSTGVTVSASLAPVSVGGVISGVVVTLSDITNIQKLESQIRRSLNEKGLVAKYTFDSIIHESDVIARTIATAKRYAASDSNIIIEGETGTGKELFAQSIHNASARSKGPFVAVNCAALPENLLESELFGYVEGAFTGTKKGGKMGLFELAHEGTLFLDEISEISLSLQSKLLRVLQEREVRRVGDTKVISVNVRIISATNKSISRLAKEGLFRSDLMYRLDVLRLFLPPLRERGRDAEVVFAHLLARLGAASGRGCPAIAPDALEPLGSYPFDGNIRELRNIVERAAVLCSNGVITKDDVAAALYPKEMEVSEHAGKEPQRAEPQSDGRAEVERALSVCGGSRSRAAELLGIDRSTLWRRMKKYGIE